MHGKWTPARPSGLDHSPAKSSPPRDYGSVSVLLQMKLGKLYKHKTTGQMRGNSCFLFCVDMELCSLNTNKAVLLWKIESMYSDPWPPSDCA